MIPSPNRFALPCAGPFHTKCMATTYQHVIKAQRYACAYLRLYANPEKYVQKSLNMDVGMHHAKNRGNKEIPLAILSRILAQSCVTPPYIIQAKGYASILDSIAKGIPCCHDFSHGASLHPYSFNE